MAGESTLAVSYADLQAEVGWFLGWGRGATYPYTDIPYTSQQQTTIDLILKSGLRQFYFPNPAFDWSFLQPIGKVDVPVNVQSIPLPPDFGGSNGIVTIQNTTTQLTWSLRFSNEGVIRQMYQVTPNATGRPVSIAITWNKGTAATEGSRATLLIYPITDQEYTFQIPYYVTPDYLSTAFPYAPGGAHHAETIRAACLAAAEETADDMPSTWQAKFKDRLAASMNTDRRSKPSVVGYNGDQSDMIGRWRRSDWHGWGSVSVNGVVPGAPPYG